MIVIDYIIVGPDLRIVGQIGHRIDDCIDEVAAALEDSHPFVARPRRKHLVEYRDQRRGVLAARLDVGETWILDQFSLVDNFTEIFPVTIGLQHR